MRDEPSQRSTAVAVDLKASPERQLIHSTDNSSAIVFFAHVSSASDGQQQRLPLSLALVLDRSGSMQGAKLQMAKEAVLSVLDHLTARDKVSLVVFDNKIETLQAVDAVTPQLKSHVRKALDGLQARASTALHEGWLTGCNSIVGKTKAAQKESQGLARCFLLTDGMANVGKTDPEYIASEAAGVHEHESISTSTFGIGADYNELLLGPMAVAGGGQFHHLRSPDEIVNTFLGELGEMLAVAAFQVRLEIETAQGVDLDLISPYWMRSASDNPLRRVISIGDLSRGEESPVVVRCTFPAQDQGEPQVIRARLTWHTDGNEHATAWQELRFSYASQHDCESETRDPQVLHWVAQHESDRARREAIASNNRGDAAGAQKHLQQAVAKMNTYGLASPAAQQEMASLTDLAEQFGQAPMAPAAAKEVYYDQQRRSRNKADHRQGSQPATAPVSPEAAVPDQPPVQDQKTRRKLRLPWSPNEDEKTSR